MSGVKGEQPGCIGILDGADIGEPEGVDDITAFRVTLEDKDGEGERILTRDR